MREESTGGEKSTKERENNLAKSSQSNWGDNYHTWGCTDILTWLGPVMHIYFPKGIRNPAPMIKRDPASLLILCCLPS